MIAWIFKVILCSGLFLLVYSVFLEKEKMHRFNRFYLLFSILFSLVLPFITIHINNDTPLHAVDEMVFSPVNIVDYPGLSREPLQMQPHSGFIETIPVFYWLITGFFLVLFARNIWMMYSKIHGRKFILYKGSRLILTEENMTPHSFLNYILLNSHDYRNGSIEKEILWHELTHVRERHTIDILLFELITAFCWFNPFMYLYKRAARLNHEFLADESVINRFQNIHAYQALLMDKTNLMPALAVTSQFNFLIIKKRLVMITRHTSRSIAIFKKCVVLTLFVAAIFAFSSKAILAQETPEKNEHLSKVQPNNSDTAKRPMRNEFFAGGTVEGVSPALLNEYREIVIRNKKPGMSWLEFRKDIPVSDRDRLEEIFLQMSFLQQKYETVVFGKPERPLPKIVPTQKQFINFKNPKVYGVWIDGKKIPNSKLNQFRAGDFSHVFISKLYGAAKKGRIYSYQVDMMTNDYYQSYNKKVRADRSNPMYFQFRRPVAKK